MLLDHIVIHVNDLEAASADYRSLGFTVTPGGEHADGNSHNALIPFSDGAYLELIAFKRPPPPEHLFARGVARGEGMITYALLPDNIEADVAAAKRRGLHLDGPYPGGRLRPDGVQLEWQTARASTPDLPFLCADVTSRELRVPGGEAIEHPNTATGIFGIIVVVLDLNISTDRYRSLLDTEPYMTPKAAPGLNGYEAAFKVGNTSIVLVEPVEGPILDISRETGEGPYSIVLQADPSVWARYTDTSLVHSVRMQIKALEQQKG